MCLLGLGFQTIPDCPLFLLANREESFSRATIGPRPNPACRGRQEWFGGLDHQAGGTWLGVNARGLVVAVTNRSQRTPPQQPLSRGLLCRALLGELDARHGRGVCETSLQQRRFAGCNVLIADRNQAYLVEAGDELRTTELSPGWHLVTNGDLNDPHDRRIRRVRSELSATNPQDVGSWVAAAKKICGLRATAADAPVCLEGPGRGTVSSTICAIPDDLPRATYWYAGGPPTVTPYEDYSSQLAQMLGFDGRYSGIHSIRLADPWHVESFDAVAGRETGPTRSRVVEADRGEFPVEPPLPGGSIGDQVRLARRFHRPTNLGPQDRVLIVFQGTPGAGTVRLNGGWLGTLSELESCQCFDARPHLRTGNLLEIELACRKPPENAAPNALVGPVALEIRPA
ncbi:MAG: NRDE family protein [Planctomycetaceae bacterium]